MSPEKQAFKVCIYTSDFKLWNKVNENGDFECQCIKSHSEEKTESLVVLHFSHQNASTKLPSWVFGIYFSWRNAERWFVLAQRRHNLELVNVKCVTYIQPKSSRRGMEQKFPTIWTEGDVSVPPYCGKLTIFWQIFTNLWPKSADFAL